MEEGIGAFPAIVAKTLTIVNVMSDEWVVVQNYAGSSERAVLLEVTPVQCVGEMYSNAEWILLTAFSWLLPRFVDVMAGLALTRV